MSTSRFQASAGVRNVAAKLGRVALVLPWLLVGNGGATDPQARDDAGGTHAESAGRLSIRVAPRDVYEGGLVALSVVRDGEAPGSGWQPSWLVGDGTLHADDLPEVDWRAPERSGPVEIRVRLARGPGSPEASREEASRTVQVRAPSVDGMVWIPPGPFVMGDLTNAYDASQVKTIQNSGDEPPLRVDLKGYWIDRLPVTNEQYRAFLEGCLEQGLARITAVAVLGRFEGSEVPFYYFQSFETLISEAVRGKVGRRPVFRHDLRYEGAPAEGRLRIEAGRERCAVVDVTWFGAAAYAAYYGKTLPTEAQWEKAARGTDGRRFPWGSNVPSAYHAALVQGRRDEPPPVGSFSPTGDSPFGVADMFSGIFEWTDDWFNPHFYSDNAMDAPVRDPEGPFWGRAHAIRGAPHLLRHPAASLESVEPVSSRYSWHFEFFLGDSFANAETGFRTVLVERG